MPDVPPGCKLVLDPKDDFNHTPDAFSNYNESMYFSVLDPKQKMGGWYRLGNRVNEGYAEMSTCWYLPDGRVAFMASRPQISTNEVMDAGGLRFEILEPFERQRITYEGRVCLLEDPHQMANPGAAFRNNPNVDCRLEIIHTKASPCVGGEVVHEDGTPLPVDPEKGFGKAHFDQEMYGEGFLEVGGERFELRGAGARDKTWGPRYWQSIDWYRWVHFHVKPELSIIATIMTDEHGTRCSGFRLSEDSHSEIEEGDIEIEWDDDWYQRSFRMNLRTGEERYEIEGRARALIPLRNRRQLDDGSWLMTRITEALTDYTCNGEPAIGMSEFLDQIVDGRPVGV